MGMIKEFKEFAVKGNLLDLAIAFVMGSAFTKLTTSFIDNLIMPIVGLVQGKDLSEWTLVLKPESLNESGKKIAEIAIKYGDFISVIIQFVIVTFVMFLIIRTINKMKKAEITNVAPVEPSVTEKLLIEIRDSLKK